MMANNTNTLKKQKLIGCWGEPTAEAITKLGLNYCRIVEKPTEEASKRLSNSKLFMTVNLKPRNNGEFRPIPEYIKDAVTWSRYSKTNNKIIAISQDDFRGWWVKYAKKDKNILTELHSAIKGQNKNLLFGATIYEDDFLKLSTEELVFWGQYIELVHFYLHKRPNINNYQKYLKLLQKYFPSALVILGVYRYDRRQYEKRKTNVAEELYLFREQLQACITMQKYKNIIGLEFYYGRLGSDDKILDKYDFTSESSTAFRKMSQEINRQLVNTNIH